MTLGSTTGTPSQNICFSGIGCTYVPFNGVSAPQLEVPFDGTVTTFSVNAGSAGGKVQLRVLRPAGSGEFTGSGTSAAQTLATGVNTFTVSLPVKAGDVLGLDNSTSALMFDTTTPTAIAAYYQPSLADGSTAAPSNNMTGYRLLLSATVQATTTTTTTTTTTATTPPVITSAKESHTTWRLGSHLATISRQRRPPTGTTFMITLNEPAQVTLPFTQLTKGRRVHGKCAAQTKANRSKPSCQREVLQGTLRFTGHAGVNRVNFQGRLSRTKKLPLGQYLVEIIATNSSRETSNTVPLGFTIVK